MKKIIRKILKEYTLSEIKVIEKPVFGQGVQHFIYQSKNPKILYKVGKNRNDIMYLIKLSKEAPDFFPKTYKSGMARSKKSHHNYYYVEVEKLNTKKVIDEFKKIDYALEEAGVVNLDVDFMATDEIIYRLLKNNDKNIDKYVKALKNHPVESELFVSWANFIFELKSVVFDLAHINLDAHRYNYGYDDNGNKKCLDF